jgi:glycosyltransferase involved in cell wall biosynthesis
LLNPEAIKRAREGTNIRNVRQDLRMEEDELFLLHVGALIRTKNVYNLIKALSAWGWEQKFRLVLVGDGPERVRIEKLLRRLNLEGKVTLPGKKPHDETLSIMKSSDVLLLSSICEQMPNVVLEALALGKPVIATRVGGIPEIKSQNLHLIDRLEEIGQVIEGGVAAVEEDIIRETAERGESHLYLGNRLHRLFIDGPFRQPWCQMPGNGHRCRQGRPGKPG